MSRHRLIVGLDYGTTYSGISYVTTDKAQLEDICVIRSWPGKDGEWKTPTRIAYAVENYKASLTEDQWGYRAEAPMVMCSWTKLLLDSSVDPAQNDDRQLKSAIDSGKLRLPAHRDAQGVAADFLREMYKFFERKLVKELGQDIVNSTPMDVWLTVPATWSDQAQSSTRAAALEAGFGKRNGDSISVITEPEAAAVVVLKNISRPGALNRPRPGENILICDCGGGTVDITSYTIDQIDPKPLFEEICVGIGAKCGSTSIDRALHGLMKERFGSAWDQIEERRRGAGSNFMEKWEKVKRSFGESGDDRVQELQLNIRGASDSQWYNEEEGMVRLSKADVAQVFEPTVQEVIALVTRQHKSIVGLGKTLHRLVLVGGFGESAYLYARLRDWCKANGGIQPFCPEYPQAAIVRGAALRGLIGIAPRMKRCRRHYGCSLNMDFREGVDPETDVYYDIVTSRKMCRNRMEWMIHKGAEITEDTRGTHSVVFTQKVSDDDKTHTLKFYSSNHEQAPDWQSSQTTDLVGTVSVDLSKIMLSAFKSSRQWGLLGSRYQKVPVDLQVNFGAKSGLLGVKVLCGGVVTGSAEIVFD